MKKILNIVKKISKNMVSNYIEGCNIIYGNYSIYRK